MRYSQTYIKPKVCDNSSCDSRRLLRSGGMTPHQIRAELYARNMNIRDLAEATGIKENFLSKILGKAARKITAEEMRLIEGVLAPEDLGERIRTIPHLGEVPAGQFRAEEQIGGRRIPVSDPETPANAYSLTVRGNSMDLIVPDGTNLVIDPDDKALWPGRRYVVQTEDGRATFKEFQTDPARLVPCSSDDSHKEILLGSEPVIVAGRVYSYTLRDADLPRRSAQ
jgi:SOS-response transcriptional repressor LexA